MPVPIRYVRLKGHVLTGARERKASRPIEKGIPSVGTTTLRRHIYFKGVAALLASCMVASLFLVLLVQRPAQAFSGTNGPIAFASNRNGGWDIYRITSPTDTNVKQLTSNQGNNEYPAFSADGKSIVFQSNYNRGSGSSSLYDIYTMNADGTNLLELTPSLEPGDKYSFPSFSPDGSEVTFTRVDPGGCASIWLMWLTKDANGFVTGQRGALNLTMDDCTSGHTSGSANSVFSLDGSKIAFVSDRDGNDQIYTIPSTIPASGTPSPATNISNTTTGIDDNPSFSPDGSHITFTRSNLDSSHKQIYVMDADGQHQQNLSNSSSNDQNSAFSPDGKQIAFQSDRSGSQAVYVMDSTTGSNQKALASTSTGSASGEPDWGPKAAPPYVKTWTPADTTGISTSTNPTVTFSTDMDRSTLTDANIKLQIKTSKGWSNISHSVSYESSTKTATITPSAPLKASKKYRVLVTTKVEDTLGTALDQSRSTSGNQPFKFSFAPGTT